MYYSKNRLSRHFWNWLFGRLCGNKVCSYNAFRWYKNSCLISKVTNRKV